jgi:parallel beta-helix repeat protein
LFNLKKLISSITVLILCASTIPLVSSQPNGPENFAANAKDKARLGTFAFYYPWYATPDVSLMWGQWASSGHDPSNITGGRRDIAAVDYPLLGVYDSNNETLIKEHIDLARQAGIDGFIVSWWGNDTFTDDASMHVRNACEQNNFTFTFYYEVTSSVEKTEADIEYILNNYANSSAYYKIDGRPVIYVYSRARNDLNPLQNWNFHGYEVNETLGIKPFWLLSEPVRKPPRYGVFPIEPNPDELGSDGIGYIENAKPIFLQPNETYVLRTSISDIRNDAGPQSDVGFRIKIKNGTEWKTLLDDTIVNFDDGWLDLNFNISEYAGQEVTVRVESFAGGLEKWNSEWAAVDYLYIENSKGEIVSPDPFFDNNWKTVVEDLNIRGFDPFLCMDLGGYETQIQDFAEYFLNFTDGMHTYNPLSYSQRISETLRVYTEASNAAHLKNKIFVATVTPGFDNSAVSNQPLVLERYNGTYYSLQWSAAEACFPDGYAVTSFNEWLEGTEIEPSLEYAYRYINLTRNPPTVCTVDDDKPADFASIQEAINAASPGEAVIVSEGTYAEGQINVTKSLTLLANGTVELDGQGERSGIYVAADNVAIDGFTIKNVNASFWGIEAHGAKDLLMMETTMQDHSGHGGILLSNCERAGVRYDLLFNASQNGPGIELDTCNSVSLRDNNATSNGYGIQLVNSENSSIRQNYIVGNGYGVELRNSSGNSIWANSVIENSQEGVLLHECSGNRVFGNNITKNPDGISLDSASNNNISENNITRNDFSGVSLHSSSGNKIAKNNIILNWYGLRITTCSENAIDENNVTANTICGAYLEGSLNNTFSENIFEDDYVGLNFGLSLYNAVFGNTITANSGCGISLFSSSNNNMSANHITNNGYGLMFEWLTNDNRIFENEIGNNQGGFHFSDSSGNVVYHNNFVNNTVYEVVTGSRCVNVWDDGYPSGGNYWSDYVGADVYSGVYQNDTGYDWISDSPYVMDQNNVDRYPLLYPFVPEVEEIRIAYRSLLVKYDAAQLQLDVLNSTLSNLMDNFTSLQAKYDSLQSNNTDMQEQISSLNSTIKDLQRTIDNLTQSFDAANARANNVQTQVDSLNNQVNDLTNLAYVFITLTIVLAAATVYLIRRKPKTKPET